MSPTMPSPTEIPCLFATFPSQLSPPACRSIIRAAQKSDVSRQPSVRKRARVSFPPNSRTANPSRPQRSSTNGIEDAITSRAYVMLPRLIQRDIDNLPCSEVLKAVTALVHGGKWAAVVQVFDMAHASPRLRSQFTHRMYTAFFYAVMKIGNEHNVKKAYREWLDIVEKRQDKLLISPRSFNFLSVALSRLGMVDEVIEVRRTCLAHGYYLNLYSSNSFLNACTKTNRIEDAFEALRQMAETNVSPDVITFNMLISCCVRIGDVEVAIGILHRMKDWGISPDIYSYNSVVNGLRKYEMLDEALELVAKMEITAAGDCKVSLITDIPRGDVSCNASSDDDSISSDSTNPANEGESHIDRKKIASMIRMLGASDILAAPERQMTVSNQENHEDVPSFDVTQRVDSNDDGELRTGRPDLQPTGILPDEVTYNTIISGIASLGIPNYDWAVRVKRHMEARGISCNEVTYHALLASSARANLLDESFQILDEMVSYGLKPSREFFVTLITLCGRTGQMEKAIGIHADMIASGIEPSVITYNALLTACRCSGGAEAADACLKVLNTMKGTSCPPDVVTYSTLIDILGRFGRFGDVSKILDEMAENRIKPNLVTYTSVISALTRAGDLRGALRVLNDMESHGIKPNVYTFSSLIYGAGRSKNIEMISQILGMMESRGVTPSQVTFSTLLQVALRTGKPKFMKEVVGTLEKDSRLQGSPQLQRIQRLSRNPEIFSEKMRKKAFDMMNRNLCQCLPTPTDRKSAIQL
eukprot:GFKZ01015021.1.p1 GENE.GFKZ01015021.1~~GFKZ01015021.1.p1  ORF type:complete len:819 (+),score=59.16 GFKZ01015021.1:186-2459(+)